VKRVIIGISFVLMSDALIVLVFLDVCGYFFFLTKFKLCEIVVIEESNSGVWEKSVKFVSFDDDESMMLVFVFPFVGLVMIENFVID